MISPAVKCGKSNIEDILNNPVYIGDFIFKGKRYYNANHEPIVSRELYSMCQDIIKSRTSGKSTKHDFTFSNLLKCSKCGCYLVGELKRVNTFIITARAIKAVIVNLKVMSDRKKLNKKFLKYLTN